MYFSPYLYIHPYIIYIIIIIIYLDLEDSSKIINL